MQGIRGFLAEKSGFSRGMTGKLFLRRLSMPNEIQEIMRNQPKPDDRASSKPFTETRGGKITTYYTDRLASIAIGIAFLIAIGAGALLRFGFAVHTLSAFGAALVVWSVATLVLVFAKGSVFYFSMHH
jgi:hypothetical protein